VWKGRLRSSILLLLLLLGACSAPSHHNPAAGAGKNPNVLLITVNSLRPDHLGYYGHSFASTPNIDILSYEGATFLNAYAVSDMANPSSYSLLTSTYVKRHSPYFYIGTMPHNASSLPGILKARGYVTGGCVGTFLLDKETFPPSRDFDSYFSPGKRRVVLKASDVNLFAANFLEQNREKPWFLWLNYNDLSEPYEIPKEYRNTAIPFYDQGIGYLDYSLGILLSALDKLKLRERTLIIVTATHGQAINEHGLSNEHMGLYEEIIHVPLIINFPGVISEQKNISATVTALDLLPTILDILKIPWQFPCDGSSLLPLMKGSAVNLHNQIFAESYLQRASMVRSGAWKFILYNADMATTHKNNMSYQNQAQYFSKTGGTSELFDLQEDPLEQQNLEAPTENGKPLEMRGHLTSWYKDCHRRKPEEKPPLCTQLLIRTVKLGY